MEPVEAVEEYPLRTSPCGTMADRKALYVRWIWRGYNATNIEEKTPATMLSQVTRTLEREVAIRRFSVAAMVDDQMVIE